MFEVIKLKWHSKLWCIYYETNNGNEILTKKSHIIGVP